MLLLYVPQLTWGGVALAALPQAALLLQGRRPFTRTPVAWLLLLFILSAVVGLWAAYDRQLALARLRLLLVGALLFDAAAEVRSQDRAWPMVGLAGLSAVLAGVFLLDQPLTAVLELDPRFATSPNSIGGMLAATIPFAAALLLSTFDRRSFGWALCALAALGLGAAGLWLTGSRGGLVALALASALTVSLPIAQRLQIKYGVRPIIGGLAFGLVLLVLAGIWLVPGASNALRDWMIGDETAGSRLGLYRNSLSLASEVFMLGGGLSSFPGLYSRYLLLIPYFFLGHAHNLYLDLLIEQGALGLASATALILGTIAALLLSFRPDLRGRWREHLFAGATMASLLAIWLHGWIDDPLYPSAGLPLMTLLLGLAWSPAALAGVNGGATQTWHPGAVARRLPGWIFGGLATLALVVFLLSVNVRAAAWANLGVIHMARGELVDWPAAAPDRNIDRSWLELAGQAFERALVHDPENATAHYHLGLLAGGKQNFAQAREHLEAAFAEAPGHRGVVKALGYSLAWTGELESAATLLEQIPEAAAELESYSWWWATQGRDDLASLAAELGLILAGERTDSASP